MPTEYLQAAQFVPGITYTVGGIRTKHIHLLKLAHHGGTVISDGCADTRQYSVIVVEMFLTVIEIGGSAIQVDGKLECIKHIRVMTALQCRLFKPPRAVSPGRTGQYSQFHVIDSRVSEG